MLVGRVIAQLRVQTCSPRAAHRKGFGGLVGRATEGFDGSLGITGKRRSLGQSPKRRHVVRLVEERSAQRGRDRSVKANWGRSFRRPNFNELFFPNLGFIRGNPFLKPEDAWGWDAGVELRPPRFGPIHDVALEAVWFDRDVDDEIGLTQVNSRTREWTNFASSRRRGLELGGSLVAFDRLDLTGSYTWVDTEDDDTGDTLPLSPRNSWFARAALRLGLARVWIEGRYEDEMFFDELLTFGIDDAHQFDVGVTVYLDQLPGLGRVPGGLTLTSEWTNITDEHRVEGIGLPLPGSYWTLRLRGRFTAGGEGL